jgi:hypothetical protein
LKRPSTVEAQERLAKIPTLRATFIGLVFGILLSLVAQLFLKPISVLPGAGGNYTVYAGSQVIWTGSAGSYYFEGGLFFAVALIAVWFLQKRLTVGTGLTL